jgi:hypothetical protein
MKTTNSLFVLFLKVEDLSKIGILYGIMILLLSCHTNERVEFSVHHHDLSVRIAGLCGDTFFRGLGDSGEVYIDTIQGTVIWINGTKVEQPQHQLLLDKNNFKFDRFISHLELEKGGSGDYYVPIQSQENGSSLRLVSVRYKESVLIREGARSDQISLIVQYMDEIGDARVTIRQDVDELDLMNVLRWANDLNDRLTIKRSPQ